MRLAAALFAIAAVAACLGISEWAGGLRIRGTLRPFAWMIGSKGPLRRLSAAADLHDRLVAAGGPAGLGLREWLTLKGSCAVLAAVAALGLGSVAPGRVPVLLILAAPIAGFLAPDHWLARVSRRRLEAAVTELPDMLDLFRVTVEAGMAPARALGAVAGQFDGPLAQEWNRLAAEMAVGVPQEEALAALARRLPSDEIRSFVEALGRSRRHGVPLGRAAAAQAAVARHQRRRRVRERAARAGPKIQLVVALLLVPSVLLLIAAGVVAELEQSPFRFPG